MKYGEYTYPDSKDEITVTFIGVPLQKIWLFYKTSEKHHKSDIYTP
jgi:hypothetical protein